MNIIDTFNNFLIKYPQSKVFGFSIIVVAGLLFIKKLIEKSIHKKSLSSDEKTFLIQKLDNYFKLVLVIALLLVWFSELQVFLVSFLAFAVATVIAFKELIMCLTGGMLLKTSGTFSVGHRIEVDEKRGFVLEINWLTTKILEIGPERNSQQTTGDVVIIPNSLLLSHHVKNESYFKGYSIKTFSFKLVKLDLIKNFEQSLLQKAKEISSPYMGIAKQEIADFCQRERIIIPTLEPRTKVTFDQEKELTIATVVVKLPVQISKISDTEQELTRFFLEWALENKVQG